MSKDKTCINIFLCTDFVRWC